MFGDLRFVMLFLMLALQGFGGCCGFSTSGDAAGYFIAVLLVRWKQTVGVLNCFADCKSL